MSFWELWDNFSKVRSNWFDSKDLLYYFIEFISHKIEVEKEYSSGLLRLTRAVVFSRGKNTIIPSLTRIQTHLHQQSLNINQLIQHQQEDLIPSLKALLQQQDEIIKLKARYGSDFQSEMQKHQKCCEKSRDNYFSICEQSLTPTKAEENASKKYKKAIEDANGFIVIFEENMKQILSIYQFQEEEKLKLLKDSMRKYIIYEMACCRNIQYELELLPMAVDAFNVDIEIKKFIDDSSSGNELKKFALEVHPTRLNSDIGIDTYGIQQNDILDEIFEKC